MFRDLLIADLLFATSNVAAQRTGNDILHECAAIIGEREPSSLQEAMPDTHCAGFVAGLNDRLTVLNTLAPEGQLTCIPQEGPETSQAILAYLK